MINFFGPPGLAFDSRIAAIVLKYQNTTFDNFITSKIIIDKDSAEGKKE